MRDNVLWRKIARITIMISETLHVSSETALDLFYSSKVYSMLVDPKYGLQTMSDAYILEEFMNEVRQRGNNSQSAAKNTDEQQLDLFVSLLKQQMRLSGATPEQCEAFDKQIDEAAHKTKLLMATYEGNVQKALQEALNLINKNNHIIEKNDSSPITSPQVLTKGYEDFEGGF